MDDLSHYTHKSHADSREKFDYFILALIIAVLTYLAKDIQYGKIGCNVSTIYLLSLVVFSASALAGFKRIEMGFESHRVNFMIAQASENSDLGSKERYIRLFNRVKCRALRCYQVRNICFFLGFICFIVGKVLSAYLVV